MPNDSSPPSVKRRNIGSAPVSLWLVLFLPSPWGLWAGGLFGDGGNLGGFGPGTGSAWGVRGIRADGTGVLQL